MTAFNFCKFHGFGNDYLVAMRYDIDPKTSLPELGKSICHRHTGVGADGISILEKLDGGMADYFCEIVNPDGSFAGFSGNGTRCAVSYLYYKGLWSAENLRLETRSGVKNYRLIERKGSGEFWFEAEIGKPKFGSDEIPVMSDTRLDHVTDGQLTVNGEEITFAGVNVGNPVACVFVDDFDFDWRTLGKAMETHERFPDRANIVFVRVMDRENIEIRIWERAAGETAASGTCASGSAVLSALMNKTGRNVSVHSEGGMTLVNWRDDDEMVITGRADLAFCGTWSL
ncbi:MAG: diaminopimelate epimerase [Chloracidobacterium sp.]|nr:diaminopimelate epimerase [Chloracidobacterium sp.]